MSAHTLSKAQLEGHLAEQLGFLQRSAHAFDQGYHSEAKRIALTLRILLHSHRYPSLLKQLGQNGMAFVDTADAPDPDNLLTTHSLIGIRLGEGKPRYVAKLDGIGPMRTLPFHDWWTATVFVDKNRREMSRAALVRSVADQDGGAHVDASLGSDYAALKHGNSLGWCTATSGPPEPLNNPEEAAIRQVAHEVLRTLIPGYTRTRKDVSDAIRPPEISGGKMRFYPDREVFYRNEPAGPVMAGKNYVIEISIDSITSGSVRVVVGGAVSAPISTPGEYSETMPAGSSQDLGVFGSFTDAVVDHVSVREVLTA